MKWIVIVVTCATLVSGLNVDDDCITPYNKPGKCVPVRKCDYTLEIVRKTDATYKDSQYLENSTCGHQPGPSPIPLTCCPALLNPESCGVIDLSKRIVGGNITKLEEHPWAALLIYDITGNNTLVPNCGASLLNSRYVLTAAHCIANVPKRWKLRYVRLGEWNATSTENCTIVNENEEICRQDYEIEDTIVHQEYNATARNKLNDITLLKLATDVEFSKYIKPICLPFDETIWNMPIDDEDFTVTGWGKTETATRSGIQLHVDIIGKSLDACNKIFSVANITLADTQICVGGEEGKDSCKGDSGGPLMRQVGLVWYQVGVVSFGHRFCGTKGFPGIYTNVAKYLKWIEQKVNKSHTPTDNNTAF